MWDDQGWLHIIVKQVIEPHRQQQVLLCSEGEQPMPDRGENAWLEILGAS